MKSMKDGGGVIEMREKAHFKAKGKKTLYRMANLFTEKDFTFGDLACYVGRGKKSDPQIFFLISRQNVKLSFTFHFSCGLS